MRTLYCLHAEGYTAAQAGSFMGGPDRVRALKTGLEVRQGDIAGLFADEDAVSCINAYEVYKYTQALPYPGTADCPYWLVQTIATLKPLDAYYHPKVNLF